MIEGNEPLGGWVEEPPPWQAGEIMLRGDVEPVALDISTVPSRLHQLFGLIGEERGKEASSDFAEVRKTWRLIALLGDLRRKRFQLGNIVPERGANSPVS